MKIALIIILAPFVLSFVLFGVMYIWGAIASWW